MTSSPTRTEREAPRPISDRSQQLLAFDRAHLGSIVEWLTLNHGTLDIFFHPNTGDALRDHRDAAMWIGHSHPLNLAALGG